MEMIFDSHLHFFTREGIRFYSQQSPEFSQLKDPTDCASDKLGIFPPPENPQELAKLWVKELDRNKVSRAILFGSILGEQASIEKAIKLFPNRFVGFQLVDPTDPAASDIVEDIVSTGGSIFELIELLNKYEANIIGIVCIVNRSQKNINFNLNFDSLLSFPSESWEENECPEWLKKISISKPGSTGK